MTTGAVLSEIHGLTFGPVTVRNSSGLRSGGRSASNHRGEFLV